MLFEVALGLTRAPLAVYPIIAGLGLVSMLMVNSINVMVQNSVPDALRYSAVIVGFLAFISIRKSIFAGVLCGEIVLIAGKWWLG